jgi:hypothetical protein
LFTRHYYQWPTGANNPHSARRLSQRTVVVPLLEGVGADMESADSCIGLPIGDLGRRIAPATPQQQPEAMGRMADGVGGQRGLSGIRLVEP